jgi:hypothetical protein
MRPRFDYQGRWPNFASTSWLMSARESFGKVMTKTFMKTLRKSFYE